MYRGLCVAAEAPGSELLPAFKRSLLLLLTLKVSLSVKFYMWKYFGYKCVKLGIKE